MITGLFIWLLFWLYGYWFCYIVIRLVIWLLVWLYDYWFGYMIVDLVIVLVIWLLFWLLVCLYGY